MPKFVYLFSAEDSSGQTFVFQADGAFSAKPGDLIMYSGDIFAIRKTNYCAVDGDDYAMISDIADIRKADIIYSPIWQNSEDLIVDEPS